MTRIASQWTTKPHEVVAGFQPRTRRIFGIRTYPGRARNKQGDNVGRSVMQGNLAAYHSVPKFDDILDTTLICKRLSNKTQMHVNCGVILAALKIEKFSTRAAS